MGTPRILVLLVLPDEEEQWSDQSEATLLLRRCSYWLSLRGMEPTTNLTGVRVRIPRANVFSVETLRLLMDKVRKEQDL